MAVIIGMDPHKGSATIEVVDERAQVLAAGRYGTDKIGYAEMLAGRIHPDRVWAIEGCKRHRQAHRNRLVHDGETVVDVLPKLSAQVRVFATGNGRKTDPVDAHSVAMVALRTPNLVQVHVDPELVVMGMLVDRRDELGRARTQTINRLHRVLLELFPRRGKTVPVLASGSRDDRDHQAARHRGQDQAPPRRRAERTLSSRGSTRRSRPRRRISKSSLSPVVPH